MNDQRPSKTSKEKPATPADIRARLGHPIIDVDGHILEYRKIVLDYLEELFGAKMRREFLAWDEQARQRHWDNASPADRLNFRMGRPQFWATAARNTLDRATAVFPALRRARMDETGIDYAILYPSAGLLYVNLPHDQFRPALCRAYNTMVADLFRDHRDRMTPVAIIPAFTPDEAIEELDYAVGRLGLKAVKLANFVIRTVPAAESAPPDIARAAQWHDMLALDSLYDYDPVWARCLELGVAVTAHNTTFGMGMRRSTSNFMFNHCGHFAAGGEMFAKALFFGGVTARFPGLKFGFLEGGVAWGGVLLQGLVGRWEKRNASVIEQYNSANVDLSLMRELFDQYAGDMISTHISKDDGVDPPPRDVGLGPDDRANPAMLDDFAACGVTRPKDIADIFTNAFYFGCEADDPYAGVAVRGEGMPFGARINAMFSSDIGHWDVVDSLGVVPEAHEQFEDGLMDERQYRDFMFANAARLHGGMNPDFFKGTIIENEVSGLLGKKSLSSSR